ncbi:hypothetical protein ACKWTF_006246 [Chironomus riparius]
MEELDDSMNDVLANMDIPDDIQPTTSKTSVNSKETSQNKAQNEVKLITSAKIQVHSNQKGNPLLKSITNVPWEYNDKIVPDYVVGKHACILFLSIKYHNLKPDYIHERLKQLGKNYELRILLVHIDVKECHNPLKHLTRICLLTDMTLMLAWSYDEAGKIVENYKLYENVSAEKLMERQDDIDDHQKVVNALTAIKSVNKTDAATILTNFGTLENLVKASESQLASCIGLGPKKAQQLIKLFNEPFLK